MNYPQNNLMFISCVFGNKFNKVHMAPDRINSFLFTNNKEIKQEVINKGWNFVHVNKPLVNDYLTSSLQSKYIKFLIFLDDYPEFKKYKHIVYLDHKIFTKPDLIVYEVKKLISTTHKYLIICKTPAYKNSIFTEINQATMKDHRDKTSRYIKNMDKTKQFVNELIQKKEITQNVRICSTGLIIYTNINKIRNLITSVYNKCIEHQQPQCQIYWSIFSQKYDNKIEKINWTDLKNITPFIIP